VDFNITAGSEVIGRYEPVSSLTLSNTSLNKTYVANNILTQNTVTVPKKAKLVGGTDIDIKPDFATNTGSKFRALVKESVQSPLRYFI
jgi:hypothetical protein